MNPSYRALQTKGMSVTSKKPLIVILLFWLLFFIEAGKEYFIPIEWSKRDCVTLRKELDRLDPNRLRMCIEFHSRPSENQNLEEKIYQHFYGNENQ